MKTKKMTAKKEARVCGRWAVEHCPYCGEVTQILQDNRVLKVGGCEPHKDWRYHLLCSNTECGRMVVNGKSRVDCVAVWNVRAPILKSNRKGA